MHGLSIDCSECCITKFFFIFLLQACATFIAMEKLYNRWVAVLAFVYELGHVLEKVEDAWFIHSKGSNKNVKSSDGGIRTLQM